MIFNNLTRTEGWSPEQWSPGDVSNAENSFTLCHTSSAILRDISRYMQGVHSSNRCLDIIWVYSLYMYIYMIVLSHHLAAAIIINHNNYTLCLDITHRFHSTSYDILQRCPISDHIFLHAVKMWVQARPKHYVDSCPLKVVLGRMHCVSCWPHRVYKWVCHEAVVIHMGQDMGLLSYM